MEELDVSRETSEPLGTILSMEDIKRGLSDMARTGEGAQRAQAYRMLMNMESAAVTLPPPMTESDVIDNIILLVKPFGPEVTRIAYKRAFPKTAEVKAVDSQAILHPTDDGMLTTQEREDARRWSKSSQLTKKHCPELKRIGGGQLPGMPRKGGYPLQCQFRYNRIVEVLIARKQYLLDTVAQNHKESDGKEAQRSAEGEENPAVQGD